MITLSDTDTTARPDARVRHRAALAAAEQLLASTVDDIHPGTPAPKLLAFLTRYRAHLAALVAASKPAPEQDSPPAQ